MKQPAHLPATAPADQWFRDQLALRRDRLTRLPEAQRDATVGRLIARVDDALDRLRSGGYGSCERCHDPIEVRRLVGDPSTRVCLGCLGERERRALEYDLELAATAQRALLPPENVRTDSWRLAHRYRPRGPVSGDYCDVLLPAGGDGPVWFILGDVSGKGVAASILMAHIQALFRSLVAVDQDPDELAARANRILCEGVLAGSYSTLLLGRAAPDGEVAICNAGHEAPLLSGREQARSFEATGLPLGLFRDSTYEATRFRMGPGDSLLLFTDGLTEAVDPGGAAYGRSRAEAFARELNGSTPTDALDRWLGDLQRFRGPEPLEDDLTLMMVRRES